MENNIAHTEIVNSPLDKVWQHLLYKIDYPEKFVPHVSDVVVIEKNEEATIRQMKINMPDKAITIMEKITATPYVVRFEIMEHPLVNGFVENLAEAIDLQTTRLTYTMNWINKESHQSENKPEVLKAAVLKSKNYIEEHP